MKKLVVAFLELAKASSNWRMHWTEVLFLRYLVDSVSVETRRGTTCVAFSDAGTCPMATDVSTELLLYNI
jgi:hypothetical protein